MPFGQRVRELRKSKKLTLRALASEVGINFTYLSKIENGKLDFSEFPSENLIRKLAMALEGNLDELMLLAKKIPDSVRDRVIQRPEVFRKLAALDDEALDRLVRAIDDEKL